MQDPQPPPPVTSPPPFLPDGTAPPSMPPALAGNGVVVREEDKTMGMLCHLLGIFTGFLGPLILWLVKKDSCPFVGHHGREALNFQITVFICLFGLMAVVFMLTAAFVFAGAPPIPMFLLPLFFVLQVLAIVAEIMAAIAAQRGEWHRYPFCLRMV